MAGFWGKRKRDQQELQAHDADLAKRAGTALVAADERIRVITDELVFAEAELGPDATKPLSEALAAVRQHLGEAFRLNQLNHDEIPDTAEELRDRNARIVQLCDWAEDVLDERTAALADKIARARRAPEIIAGVRADAARLRTRIPHARDTIERLAARYAPRGARPGGGQPRAGRSAARIRRAQRGRGRAPARGRAARAGQSRARGIDRIGAPRGDPPRCGGDLRDRGAAGRVHVGGDRRGLPRRPRRRAQGAALARCRDRDRRPAGRPRRASRRSASTPTRSPS